ncbi:amino acid adenylation domain-containing protein [Gordonia sp. TBRC 11910]|uniref:Amino acid adenylation domain-containing protein n=1 Tax=Gordonia asplenii TaxID=2725283 RepID=A0A848L109_9ACTN|nr:non-ribosomal peptide synthetase [Gordonia asplenii]NMO04152.1 amino acid adenylation domain-containing protein [Gordonia asplenii]
MTAGHAPVGTRGALTAAQCRIWFGLNRSRGDAERYTVCSTIRVDGSLDRRELRAALTAVLCGNVATASTYHVGDDGEPYRRDAALEPVWSEIDLRGLDEQVLARRIEILRRRERSRTFDLEAESPVRVTVVATGDTEHLLVITAHAIAWDDDALRGLLAGLADEYRKPRTATRFDAAGEPGESAAIDAAYWQAQLGAPPARVDLPGRTDSPVQTVIAVDLAPDTLVTARRYAQSRGVDLAAVLTAVHSALVLRYTGAADIITAMPVSGRAPTTRISQCGNLIMLRTQTPAHRAFDECVTDAAAVYEQALRRRDDRVDRVVDAVRPADARGADGLANLTGLGLAIRQPVPGRIFGGLIVDVVEAGRTAPAVGWHLDVDVDPRHPRVTLTATGADPDVAATYPAHFATLLDAALAQPHRPVGGLALLTAAQHVRVVEHGRGTTLSHRSTTVTDLVQNAAASTPEAIAVLADTGGAITEITYHALNERANRLARYLAGRGIGAEDVVGLQLPGSIEFVVALLATLKAGAAYLPVDPAHPAERREILIADARPRLWWTADAVKEAEIAAAQEYSTNLDDEDRVRPLRPDNLAYVMYTSGSTGQPKGVPVAHAAIAEHLLSFAADWDLPVDSRVLQSSSIEFDASLLDFFVTLSVGATIVLPDPSRRRDLTYLAGLITAQQITLLHVVPALLRELLALPQRADWTSLRHIAVGGEKLGGDIADRALAAFDVELRNYYGPTEAVVSATHHPIQPASGQVIEPIGRPNVDVTAFVLDDCLQLVPDGVPGELYLGGRQLARGYLDRPAATAAAYVADPFTVGARLYRTGDVVRRRADGVLHFVSRRDDQVKIRGHRVELGEITAVLAGHPDVIDCHVVAAADELGDTVLGAYLVGRAGHRPDPVSVRAFSRRLLPDAAVPSSYAVLDALPRTTSGKIDVAALGPTRQVGAAATRPARTAAEHAVAEVFSQSFDVVDVHAGHSFFDLGGHSLNAHRVLARLREALGVRLDVADLFADPTVAGVAAAVEAAQVHRPTSGGLLPPASAEAVPATAVQELAWRAGRSKVVRIVVRFTGPVDREALSTAITAVSARHDATRMSLVADDACAVGDLRHRLTVWDAVDFLDRLGDSAANDPDSANDPAPAFDAGERLWRLRLSGDTRSPVLTVVAHQAAADETSLALVVREIARAYAGGAVSENAASSFVDYALWFAACGATGESSRRWWRTAYSGLDQAIGRVDRDRLSATHRVDPGLRRRLQAVAARFGVPEQGLYETAAAVVAYRRTARPDIVVGSRAGRDGTSNTDLIGPVDGLAIARFELAGELSLSAALDQARIAVHGNDTAPGVPIDVHRATALAAAGGVPAVAITVSFDGSRYPATLDFGPTLHANVDGPTATPVEGVSLDCRVRDGGVDISVSSPVDAAGWSTDVAEVLEMFLDAPAAVVGGPLASAPGAHSMEPALRERNSTMNGSAR